MRVVSLIIAAALPCHSLAAHAGSNQRSHYLRTKHRPRRQLQSGEYRLMRAPKIVNGMKMTRVGSRMVDRDGITVKVSDDGTIGVNVDVNVDVGVNVGGKTGNGNSDETGEPECIEWETSYISASSKSSKSSGKSGKGSKGGKSSKSTGKSTKMIPVKKCVAYETKNPSMAPTTEPVPITTESPVADVSRPTPIPTMMNITPDPTGDTTPIPSVNVEVTSNPTELLNTAVPMTPSPSSVGSIIDTTDAPVLTSSFPSPAGDVSLPPVVSAPPQDNALPTLPPALSGPPQANAIPTLPPEVSAPPQANSLPTLPPALSAPPQVNALPTLPPVLSGSPQANALPTLPPALSGPPQANAIPTLPPVVSAPPQANALPTLPPALSAPPQVNTLPTLPPVLSSLQPSSQGFSSKPPSSTPSPSVLANVTSLVPTVANNISSSLVPTVVAQNGTSFVPTVVNGTSLTSASPSVNELTVLSWDFEDGSFPTSPWSTAGDGVWALDQTQFDGDGSNSIKTPDFDSEISSVPRTSNATLTLDDGFSGGVLKLRVYASVQPPRDIFSIYIDDESAAQLIDTQGWQDVALGVSPGPHTINLSYQYNIFGVDPLPESPQERLGAVWVDNVSIESLPSAEERARDELTRPPSPSPSLNLTNNPVANETSSVEPTDSPTYYPSYIPTKNPVTADDAEATKSPSYAPTYVPTS